jgi:hypothetical protein
MLALCLAGGLVRGTPAHGEVVIVQTRSAAELQAALNPSGLTITSVSTPYGANQQIGTYSGYTKQPITIGNGVVLSTGNVNFVGPPADPVTDFPQPSFDTGSPGTAEFDAYGPGHIENFASSNDVAGLQIAFHLDAPSQIQFDFVFGSVEFPFWTSQYTDSFLAFLDGTTKQISFDQNGNPVEVGKSFGGLVSTADLNTAFGFPHGVLGLTTTSAELSAGDHILLFEIGDVNDHILDSAVFIANLRTGTGVEGTEPTDPEDYPGSAVPVPGTMTLLIFGFAAFGLIRVVRPSRASAGE